MSSEDYSAEYHRLLRNLASITDDCTGLYGPAHLSFILDAEVSRSERYGYQFSLLAITLEGLRELEPSIGRLAINTLLADVGQTVKAACRLIDFAFHYGNGEFLVILPQTSKGKGSSFMSQLRDSLIRRVWLTEQGHNVRLNVSVGMVNHPADGRTKAELLQSLDKTMYLVRNGGR